jgi:hypothetical protein
MSILLLLNHYITRNMLYTLVQKLQLKLNG